MLATTALQLCRKPITIRPATACHFHIMNSAVATTQVRSSLASVAKAYVPSRRVRFQNLAPFKEEVRELRSRGAAFLTIAKILKQHSINTSHETVRRFYRYEIEQKSPRRKRSRNGAKRTQPADQRRNESNTERAPRTPVAKTERGPRIARIEDL
jgi:hypothetical protein